MKTEQKGGRGWGGWTFHANAKKKKKHSVHSKLRHKFPKPNLKTAITFEKPCTKDLKIFLLTLGRR